MAVDVFVVSMYVSVWWGSSLSFSLDRRGDGVEWHDSRADGEGQCPDCNCGDAEGLERAITGLPTAISYHTLTYPAAFNHPAS